MENQNKGTQQGNQQQQDPNLQKKPQGTDVNRDQDQQNQRNQSGNQSGQGDQDRNQSGNQGDRKSA